jgi:uncharacterized membrane protein
MTFRTALITLVVVAIVRMVRNARTARATPLEIAQRRYAAGAITRQEFEELARILTSLMADTNTRPCVAELAQRNS